MTEEVRTSDGRLLDAEPGVRREEYAEAVARLNAEDERAPVAPRQLGITNGVGPGWPDD